MPQIFRLYCNLWNIVTVLTKRINEVFVILVKLYVRCKFRTHKDG